METGKIINGTYDFEFDALFICDNGVTDDEIEGDANMDDSNMYEIIDETGGFDSEEVLTYDYEVDDQIDVGENRKVNDPKADDANIFEIIDETGGFVSNQMDDQIDVGANQKANDPKADDANIFEDLESKCKRGCDNVNMFVQTSDVPKKEKKLCCKYCHKTVSKLARHLENVHKDQPEVAKFLHLPKASKERKYIINKIKNAGTFEFNTNATLNKGQLLTSRRPNPKYGKKATDYITCAKCLDCITRKCIGAHMKWCTNKPMKGERQMLALGRKIEGRMHPDACDRLRKSIIPVMRENEVVTLIRWDWLIIIFGKKLCLRYLPSYQENHTRSQLRYAGGLLFELKRINANITDLSSMYIPSNYDSMIEALRLVGRYDVKVNEFKTPKNATATVTVVKDIGKLLVTEYIKKGDREKQTTTENFMKIMESDIGISILKAANASQDKIRRQKKDNIPITDDIKLFSQYLDRERKRYFALVSENYLKCNWISLCKLTLASIIVNDRRRTGETENMSVDEFIAREYLKKEKRSPEEDDEDYSCMLIRGKRGSDVEAYLTFHLDKCVELILKHRQRAGVSTENPYVFAVPSVINKMKTLKPCPVIEKLSKLCGAKNPSSLRGTLMRKHFATMCQSMKLDDSKVGEVAKYMGHSDVVHKKHYCLKPLDRFDITKMLAKSRGKEENYSKDVSLYSVELSIDRSVKELEHQGTTEVHEATNDDCVEILSNENEIHLVHQEPPIVPELSSTVNNRKRKISNASENDAAYKLKKVDEDGSDERSGERDDDYGPNEKITRRRYSPEEKNAIRTVFEHYYKLRKLPSEKDIEDRQANEPALICLQERRAIQIKLFIHNEFTKDKKDGKKGVKKGVKKGDKKGEKSWK